MATREELLKDLRDAEQRSEDGGEPVPVLISDLTKLNFDDLPDGVPIQPVEKIDEKGVQYPWLQRHFDGRRGFVRAGVR